MLKLSNLLLVWLVLCSFTVQAQIQVKHELGLLTLPEAPKRIVVLEYSFLDALASIGVSPVGVADDLNVDKILPQVRALIGPWTSVGMRFQPSLEVIAQLKPDLIIADLNRHQVSYEDLSKIAPTMLLRSKNETYLSSLDSALTIGKAVGKEKQMRERLKLHKTLMESYQGKFKEVGSVQFANGNERGIWMHGPLSYTGSLLDYLGVHSAIPDLKDSHLMEVNLEMLLRVNPDWLIYGRKRVTVLDRWKKNPLFKLLKISKKGHIIRVDATVWSLNRGMLAAEEIAKELDKTLTNLNSG